MKRLENKVAIVTGGGTGIGEAICKKFAKEGASVVVAGFPDDPVDDVVDSIKKAGGKAIAFKADISDEENAAKCVDTALKEYGKLHILINNAGILPATAEHQDMKTKDLLGMIKNNIHSAVFMSRAALPHLQKERGCIVSAGSEAGKQGLAQNVVYGGTKGFMHAFMEGLAVEQAKHGVRCNCVCPGPIDTAMTRKEHGPMNKEMEKMIINATPMARRGTPEEVANVYLFLASDEASYVTGALFSVDGGIVAAKGAVGQQTPDKLRKQPEGELELEHSLDGPHSLDGNK